MEIICSLGDIGLVNCCLKCCPFDWDKERSAFSIAYKKVFDALPEEEKSRIGEIWESEEPCSKVDRSLLNALLAAREAWEASSLIKRLAPSLKKILDAKSH